MAELKTKVNEASVVDFLNKIEEKEKREDSFKILSMFEKITKEKPKMWGTSIIGFGMYHYKSERSSQEGDWPLVGFSPRKQNLTLYVMPQFGNLDELIPKLGKCKTSKGCLYIKRLRDVDESILEKIIEEAYIEAKRQFLK